ncbi:MAG TPA: S41 family peptidase [Tepidisphaeraceae bacterium]|nr:S41 family peptidase [Tepidisphaeraceae bacterium]
MNRERLAWTVCILLIAFMAVRLPGTFAARDDDYAFVRTLVDIHRQVVANYVDKVEQDKLHQAAIDGMLTELDPFSVYVPPSQQEQFDRMLDQTYRGVGIQLDQTPEGRVEVVSPIEGSPAFKAGVQAGDVITKVNGESIEGLRLPEVTKKIAGPVGTPVTLTVRREGEKELDISLTREEIVVPTVKGYRRGDDGTWDYYVSDDPKIAYVRIAQFTPDTAEAVKRVMDGLLSDAMKGLILDLRFDPGGRLDQAVEVVDLFLEEGVIVRTKGRNRPEDVKTARRQGTLPNFPMIVLVNEHSASAAEIVAGSLKDNKRAVVIGTRTYGKGSVQEVIPLDKDQGELKLTVAHYYLPSGRLVHRKKDSKDWGVEPQIPVPMDDATEQAVMKSMYEADLFKRPKAATSRAATMTSTSPTTGLASAETVDTQLQTAVNTMIALLVFNGEKEAGNLPTPATVEATTAPAATAPVEEEPVVQPTTTTAPATVPTR